MLFSRNLKRAFDLVSTATDYIGPASENIPELALSAAAAASAAYKRLKSSHLPKPSVHLSGHTMVKRKRSIKAKRPRALRRRASRKARGGKRRLRRKRTRRSSKRSSSRRSNGGVLEQMVAENHVMSEYFDSVVLPPSTVADGLKCLYSSWKNTVLGASNPVSQPYGKSDPTTLRYIANLIEPTVTTGGSNLKYNLMKFHVSHALTNACNQTLRITAYLCAARRDLPNVSPYTDGIQSILGQGFAQTGINTGAVNANNAGTNTVELSPFKSPLFVDCFKILKSSRIRLKPGVTKRFGLTDNRVIRVNPQLFTNFNTGVLSWLVGAGNSPLTVEWTKGEKFYLWKVEPDGPADLGITGYTGVSGFEKLNIHTKIMHSFKYFTTARSVTFQREQVNFAQPAGSGNVNFMVEESGSPSALGIS